MSTTCDLTSDQIHQIVYALTREHHPHRRDHWLRWLTTRSARALHHRDRLVRYWITRIQTDVSALHLACTTWSRCLASLQVAAIPEEPSNGPGGQLKRMLSKIGITATPTCSCDARAREMDRLGPDWCDANLDTIVGWLGEEAVKRKLPFSPLIARFTIRRAIHLSRLAAKSTAT